MCLHFSKMSSMEHRPVIKFFTIKGLNATEISKELDNVYKNSAPSHLIVTKWVAEFKDPVRAFEDAPRMGHPSTITADENIEAVERIVIRDRQISIRRLAEELVIIYEIMNNHMGMKKVLHTVGTEIVDTNSTCQSCRFLSRAPATERSKSGQVSLLHGNLGWVLDSPLRSSQPVGSQGLEETRWTNTNSTPPRKISWKDYDDHFLG